MLKGKSLYQIIDSMMIAINSFWIVFLFKQPRLKKKQRLKRVFGAWGMLVGQPLCSCWYWCVDQTMVQRVLSAKGARCCGRFTGRESVSSVPSRNRCRQRFHIRWRGHRITSWWLVFDLQGFSMFQPSKVVISQPSTVFPCKLGSIPDLETKLATAWNRSCTDFHLAASLAITWILPIMSSWKYVCLANRDLITFIWPNMMLSSY